MERTKSWEKITAIGLDNKKRWQALADKYGLKSKSSATYISSKVFNEIEKDKKLKELFIDAYELMHESLSRQDSNDHSENIYSVGD